MNKTAILPAVFAAVLGFTGLAQAQTTTPQTAVTTPSTPHNAVTTPNAPVVSGTGSATNKAVNTAPANNSGAPVAGANSFTMGQARDRIEAKGFTKVDALMLDSKGVWRGKAMKGGQSVDVSMDYQGNVVPQ
jgi:hypothetical protein